MDKIEEKDLYVNKTYYFVSNLGIIKIIYTGCKKLSHKTQYRFKLCSNNNTRTLESLDSLTDNEEAASLKYVIIMRKNYYENRCNLEYKIEKIKEKIKELDTQSRSLELKYKDIINKYPEEIL